MKKLILLSIGIILATSGFSQNYDPNRYQESIFPTVITTNDVQYGTAPQWVWPYWDQDLNLNVNVPDNDNNQKRPLIIFAHSGGFLNGSKDVDDMVAICDSFAQKGFVTATIDYRKGFDPLDDESAERAVYRGIQDGKTAIRYFKTNASLYDIDTNYVFFGGMSAGGFIALHVGHMDKESERPTSTYGGFTVNDLGCLDCGDHTTVSSTVIGVLDFWGAVQDTSIIEDNGPPIQIMHGENDPTVPFSYGHPFGLFTIPNVHGAENIKLRCDNVGIENTYTTSSGPLHMLDGSDNGTWNPAPNDFWSDTLLPRTTNFIYDLIKPNTTLISPQTINLCTGTNNLFEVSSGNNSHYIWDFDNTNITEVNNSNQNTIELGFPTTGTYSLKVVEFNEILCAGDTLEFSIIINPTPVASYTSVISNGFDVDFTNTSTNGDTYTWDFGDGNTSTNVNPSHTYMQDGDYTVSLVVTSADGCTSNSFSELISISTSGLIDFEQNLTINSPFTNSLTITSNSMLNQIIIYSMDGKVIFTDNTPLSEKVINTTTWQSGIYILNCKDHNGMNQQRKLIKL